MGAVELQLAENAVSVDANLVAEGLGLQPGRVIEGLRDRRITAICEQGIGEDANRFRLNFYYADRRFRVVVDNAGQILECTSVKIRRRRRMPPRARSQPE